MIFSDTDITQALANGSIKIDPFDPSLLKAASYTLTLGEKLYKLKPVSFIDSRKDKPEYEEITMDENGYLLDPGAFIVGASRERITLSDSVAATISTRGSRAQQGLDAILSSSFAEPGSDNHMALEMHNAGNVPIKLFSGIGIAKIVFLPLQTPAMNRGKDKNFFTRQE